MKEISVKKSIINVVLAFVLAVGLMIPSVAAFATPSSEKKAEANAVLDKINAQQETLDKASADYATALSEQEAAEGKVAEAKEKVQQESQKIAALQEKLGTRAKSMYRTGTVSYLDTILGAESFTDFATKLSLLDTINQQDADLVMETKESRARMEAAQKEAEEQQAVAEHKASEAKEIKDRAEAAQAEMQAEYNRLNDEAKELLRQEEEERSRQAAAAAASSIGSGGGGSVNNNAVQAVTGNIIVDRAYAQLGKPYVWGACGPNSFDCSGLVGYCITGRYARFCTTYTMMGGSFVRVSNPQPGDFALNDHHTGVYIGNGQMIHAPHTGDVVRIAGVHAGMWYVRYVG